MRLINAGTGDKARRLMTISEVAAVLHVRPARAYELAKLGVLPVVRIGRQIRVPEDSLLQWIGAGGTPLAELHDADGSR